MTLQLVLCNSNLLPQRRYFAQPELHILKHFTCIFVELYTCRMDGGAWWAVVHGVAESRARLHFHFHFSLCALEKEVATHSSVLVWRIPGTGEPGGLLSMGSHRVGHD